MRLRYGTFPMSVQEVVQVVGWVVVVTFSANGRRPVENSPSCSRQQEEEFQNMTHNTTTHNTTHNITQHNTQHTTHNTTHNTQHTTQHTAQHTAHTRWREQVQRSHEKRYNILYYYNIIVVHIRRSAREVAGNGHEPLYDCLANSVPAAQFPSLGGTMVRTSQAFE
jgi:hypothetical protein